MTELKINQAMFETNFGSNEVGHSSIWVGLFTRHDDLLVAVGTAELASEPQVETVAVESVSAVGQHLHFFAFGEV